MEEDFLTCPFDPNHQIIRGSMQFHQVRCRKSILGNPADPRFKFVKSLVRCDFDSTHWVPKDQLRAHCEACPSRWQQDGTDLLGICAIEPYPKAEALSAPVDPPSPKPEGAENWEDELQEGRGYDGKRKVMESRTPILFNMQNVSRSLREDFRAEQRVKFGGMEVKSNPIPGLHVNEAKTKKNKNKKGKGKKAGVE